MESWENTFKKIEYSQNDKGVKFINIYFIRKPRKEIIQRLRKAKFYWHSQKGCWYAKNNELSVLIATALEAWDMPTFIKMSEQAAQHYSTISVSNEKNKDEKLQLSLLDLPINPPTPPQTPNKDATSDKTKKGRSEAQKAADKRYYEKTAKHRRRYISLHTMQEEREEIDRVLAENNITALELFRKAIEQLKKED